LVVPINENFENSIKEITHNFIHNHNTRANAQDHFHFDGFVRACSGSAPDRNFEGLHAVLQLCTTLHIDMEKYLPRNAKFGGSLTLNI
jgi:hypothetical protein